MPTKAAYREFCRTAPDLPVFAHDWYLDACAAGGHWDVVLVHKDGRVVASLPFFHKQKGPFRYVTMPPFVKWLGPYVLPEFRGILSKEHELLKELMAQLPTFAAFKQNFHPSMTNWLPFYWQKYQQTTYYTYRFNDLQNLSTLEAGLSRGIRRDIRQANSKLRVQHDANPERFYQLNKLSFDRQRIPVPYSQEQFMRLDVALAGQQARQYFFAVDAEGRTHSAVYLIWDRTTAYYHLAGDDPDLRASGAGIWLAWQAVRYASEVLGLTCFDFEGSMLPNVERIRVRFGATQTPYFFVWKYNSKAFKLLEKLRR